MTSVQAESKVINVLRELVVATIDVLCNKLSKSRMTVLRALKSYGYFSSFNFNSSYFTLKDIPDFDKDGLWFHGQQLLCFCSGVVTTSSRGLVE